MQAKSEKPGETRRGLESLTYVQYVRDKQCCVDVQYRGEVFKCRKGCSIQCEGMFDYLKGCLVVWGDQIMMCIVRHL